MFSFGEQICCRNETSLLGLTFSVGSGLAATDRAIRSYKETNGVIMYVHSCVAFSLFLEFIDNYRAE